MKPVVNVTVGGQKKPTNYTYKTVILKSNLPFADQIGEPNCIYVIKWDYDLEGETVTMPENCVLKFEGGSIGNGSIHGNKTIINAAIVKIFSVDVILTGSWNILCLYPEWFGAKGDGEADDRTALQHTIDMASANYTSIYQVILSGHKTYNISSHIDVKPRTIISSSYISRDKSYDGRNKPKIVVKGSDDAINLVVEEGLGDSLGFIVLNNVAIIGTTSNNYCGIKYNGNTATYIEKCRFSGLFISNFRFGIYIDANRIDQDHPHPRFNNNIIDDLSIQNNVGIGIFIKVHDVYDFIIKNSHIYYPYIGGLLLDAAVITTPVSITDCCFEGCGSGYNVDDYNTYGSFAVSCKSSSETESVNIERCYFEANAPFKKYKDGYILSENEDISSYGGISYVYIKIPNWDKTASVIIEGPQCAINNSIFNELYQLIAINNAGKLIFNDNVIYVMSLAIPLGMFTGDIVRVKDENYLCRNISVDINLKNLTSEFYHRNNEFGKLNDIKITDGTSPQWINTNVDIPILNRCYSYNVFNGIVAERSNVYYYDSEVSNPDGNGMCYAPIKYLDSLLNFISRVSKPGDNVTVVLKSDMNIDSRTVLPYGVNFAFKSYDASEKIITINDVLDIYNSTVSFNENIKIVRNHGCIFANNSNVSFKSCNIEFEVAAELVNCTGENSVLVNGCEFKLVDDSNAHYITYGVFGNADTIIINTTIASNLLYLTKSFKRYGAFDNAPDTRYLLVGSSYFATDKGSADKGAVIYFTGDAETPWVYADGTIVE